MIQPTDCAIHRCVENRASAVAYPARIKRFQACVCVATGTLTGLDDMRKLR